MLLLIWADEKYNNQKNPVLFSWPKKNSGIFHRPKNILFGQNVRPKKILRNPPSLKYVSGAPGALLQWLNDVSTLFFVKQILKSAPKALCFISQLK